MRYSWYCGAIMACVAAVSAQAQTIHCIDPPSTAPSQAACRIPVDSLTSELRLIVQVRASNGGPIPNQLIRFDATSGQMRDTARTDATGYASITWTGPAPPEPVVITASASMDGVTTRRQIHLVRRQPPAPAAPAFITSVAPTGGHSAYSSKYLNDPIEVQIEADPVTCNRTQVTAEFLSAGSVTAPQPVRTDVPALWSELDPGRFGCAAQFKWLLSSAVGEQEMRVWIKRDTSFAPPADPAGAQRYLRPRVVHAVAHPQPALVIGAALVEGSDSTDLPRVVGVDLSFPNAADVLKHHGAEGVGKFVDHLRLFVGTNFSTDTEDIGQHVYLGIEPVVLLIGPRIADLPVGFAVGRRVGEGRDRWFGTGFINAPAAFSLIASALGIT